MNKQDNPITLFITWKTIQRQHLWYSRFSNEKCEKNLWIVISILIDNYSDFYPELKRLALNLPDLQLLPFGDNDGDSLGGSHLNNRGGLLCQTQIEVMQAGGTF